MIQENQFQLQPGDMQLKKENASRLRNLGLAFEHFTSSSFTQDRVLAIGEIPSALLASNEYADFPNMVKVIGNYPDGYIYGVGAGNIFSLGSLFDQRNIPKAVFSVDLLPEAVLSGRVVVNLLRSSDNFDKFVKKLQSQKAFDTSVTDIIQSETSQELREVFQSLNSSKLIDLLEWSIRQIPNTGIIQPGRYKDRISVIAAIRENWSMLKQLVEENNIGFGLADFFDSSVMNWLKKQSGFSLSRNVIYSSNLVDYLHIGQNQNSIDPRWLSFRRALKPLDNPSNVFIFTTKESDLNLYITKGIPKFAPEGFWLT